jgi:Type I restriction enzyme R protein N terminus (HSDR_N)
MFVPEIIESLNSYNETEIRSYIIDPVLRKLGYPGSAEVFIKQEEKLEYPYHIGRRSKKDLPSGRVDYRAGLKGRRGSFVLEAKAGNVVVSKTDIEQAHSYAAHAKVGANYFVLCDGSSIQVFETLSGSECNPIVSVPIREIEARFHELENILAPANLGKHCKVNYDYGFKLCDGLGSTARIHSGEYGMDEWTYRILLGGVDQTELMRVSVPQVSELDKQLEMMANDFVLRVSDGVAGREPNGQIFALVNFSGVTKSSDVGMKLLGLDRMRFSSNEKHLSCDEDNPSIFESTADFSVAQGTKMPQLFGEAIPIETQVDGDFFISARIHKAVDQLIGDYIAMATYRFGDVRVSMELDFIGRFSLKLFS